MRIDGNIIKDFIKDKGRNNMLLGKKARQIRIKDIYEDVGKFLTEAQKLLKQESEGYVTDYERSSVDYWITQFEFMVKGLRHLKEGLNNGYK